MSFMGFLWNYMSEQWYDGIFDTINTDDSSEGISSEELRFVFAA